MPNFKELKERVFLANIAIRDRGLTIQTWGNVSEYDPEAQVLAIKPSGVPYNDMQPKHMVILDLAGKKIEGDFNPSSDTPSHLVLYKNFPQIRGVVHTHSTYATIFAQLNKSIPCFGTTHADNFYGEVPVTPMMSRPEVESEYEKETGNIIVRTFTERRISVDQMHAVLVASHGPFTWGNSGMDAVDNAEVLEEVAKMAFLCRTINPTLGAIPSYLLDKHYLRKHGTNAYYGQPTKE